MQTFLPIASFKESAKVLDWRRLGKQRVEARQILSLLLDYNSKKPWANHPAVLMWKGYTEALTLYSDVIIFEWVSRGYRNNMPILLADKVGEDQVEFPKWFGEDSFHASHRSNLLRKNFEFYSKYNWAEDSTLPYIWPSGSRSLGKAD
jgi:hypothetical protein